MDCFHTKLGPSLPPGSGRFIDSATLRKWSNSPKTPFTIVPSTSRNSIEYQEYWSRAMSRYMNKQDNDIDDFIMDLLFEDERLVDAITASEPSPPVPASFTELLESKEEVDVPAPSTSLPKIPIIKREDIFALAPPTTAEEYRKLAVIRWQDKRRRRKVTTVRHPEYNCRSVVARRRKRVGGKFVKMYKPCITMDQYTRHFLEGGNPPSKIVQI